MSKFGGVSPNPSPIVSIREKLVKLKSGREKTASDIEQLENEKAEIEATLPLLLSKLIDLGGSVDYLNSEKDIYSETIGRMKGSFGVIIDPGGERSERQLGQGEEDRHFGGPGEQVIKDLQIIASRYKKENPHAENDDETGSEKVEEEEEEPYDEEAEQRKYMVDIL